MIDDLLVYARASQEPLCRQPVELAALVDDVAAEAEIAAPRDIQVTRTHLPAVSAHPTLLRQVLANLIDNALRHGRGAPVVLRAADRGDVVELRVVDSGPGVPADRADRAPAQRRGQALRPGARGPVARPRGGGR